jgi:ESS family glutamate:Na+ symporter
MTINFTFPDLMLSFVVLSVLLLVGQILRAKLGILQRIFLPAAVIGGIIGLILGPQVVGIIPIPDVTSQLPGYLISIVYACILIAGLPVIKGMLKRLSKFFLFYIGSLHGIEIALGMGLVLFVLKILMPQLPNYMGLMIWTGFYGGHGTAAAMGSALENLGFEDATGIGMVTATIGLISGVIFGMVLVNWGIRKGYAKSINVTKELPEEVRTGIIPRSKEPNVLGKVFVSSETIDPLACMVAVVGGACAIGLGLSKVLPLIHPFLKNVPLFVLTLGGGALIRVLMEKANLGYLFDENATKRVQGLALDYLIIAGIATIPLKIVAQYLAPLTILAIAIWIGLAAFMLYTGPKLLGDAWFEKMILVYGTAHGVFATGLMLLRAVDPNFKTPALLEGGTILAIDQITLFILIVTFAPVLSMSYPTALFIVPLALVIVVLGASFCESKRRFRG